MDEKELREAMFVYDAKESPEARLARELAEIGPPTEWWLRPSGTYSGRPFLTISAAEFKARCLALMDLLAEKGGEVVVTKRGKPLARLVPFVEPPRADLRGSLLYEAPDAWDPHPEWWADSAASTNPEDDWQEP